ncbi:MAG: Rieske 2Fe-2S domain-containing protein [Alphaproteobacteria bacterium]|nr:Rieske 2Fe-2S domain-containing protein [Alphaproteobacteria bacterium]
MSDRRRRSADRPRGTRTAPKPNPNGPTVQELLEQERTEVPPVLRKTGSVFLGEEPIGKERYTSQAFFDREMTHMWSRVWQMACRADDIPAVGDYVVHRIGDTSLLVVRAEPGRIRAFYNVCLHRGRLLREEDGHAEEFRCPFHAFTWRLDGSCKQITSQWDFEYLDKDSFGLPEVHVDTWGGFVFVNLDDDPEPLQSYLEDVPADYATRGWSLEGRAKTVHVQKVNRCNWKVALEAFIESFHVLETHPGIMPYIGDAYTQYDVWPDKRHSTRMIVPRGIHSPHMAPISDLEVYRSGAKVYAPDQTRELELPEGLTPRQAMGDLRRDFLARTAGIDTSGLTDCEVLDTIQYHIFPNLVCWAGWNTFMMYRFLPNGTDVDSSIMEVMFLVPRVEGRRYEERREPTRLTADQKYTDAPELGRTGGVFEEDTSNMAAVHKGLKAMKGPGARLASYQENRIRFFHAILDSYLERPLG